MKPPAPRIAVVTGANRGIGPEICRQLAQLGCRVVLTSRDPAKGRAAADRLRRTGLDIVYHRLDVASAKSIRALYDFIVREFGAADVLVNNAAVALDGQEDVLDVEPAVYRATLETNVYGPLRLCQAFIPLMLARNYGRVVNVSSGAGTLSGPMFRDTPAYRLSKTALNALTRMLASAVGGKNVLVNAGCPGWVQTRMGGPGATRTPARGAKGIVWLATLPRNGPNGGFFRDGKRIPW